MCAENENFPEMEWEDELVSGEIETDGGEDALSGNRVLSGTHTVTVEYDESGWRLDKYLVYHFPDFSRVAMRNAITDGNVFVDGKTAKPAYKLNPGQSVRITLPELVRECPHAEDIPLDILYEDGDMAYTHCRVQGSAVRLAQYHTEKNDAENVLQYLKLAAEHAVRFAEYEQNGVNHTSLVFRGRRSEGIIFDERWNSVTQLQKEMEESRYDFLRDTAEFREITAELEAYAGQWTKSE